jgi:IS5 family transposase
MVPAQHIPGNPYDGHTLAHIIPAIEELLANKIERAHVDAGYRGHNAPPDYQFKVYTSKQKRRLTPQIEHEMTRARMSLAIRSAAARISARSLARARRSSGSSDCL